MIQPWHPKHNYRLLRTVDLARGHHLVFQCGGCGDICLILAIDFHKNLTHERVF